MKIYPILYSWEMTIWMIHMCQETLGHHASWFHLLLWTNTSTPLISENIIVKWILWSSYSFRFLEQSVIIPSLIPEGSLSNFLFETAYSASSSTDMDALKFRLVQYDTFYGGQIQQDSSECLMMIIESINKGSVSYCGSNDDNSTGVSLSKILFSFILEKYTVCDAWGLKSSWFESSSVLYITPTYTSSIQELIMQGMQQKFVYLIFMSQIVLYFLHSTSVLSFYIDVVLTLLY